MVIVKVLLIIVSLVLIAGVLLQSGSSAGLGSIDGGATSMLGAKGRAMDDLLSKVTTGAAILFMVLALLAAVI